MATMRHVHFSPDEVWEWKTGGWRVIIWAPTRGKVRGKRSVIDLHQLFGCKPGDIDLNSDYVPPVKPGAVKTYIEQHRAELV